MDTEQSIGGKYEILDELGRGGMGAVYRVRHSELGKIYAMKVLRPDLVAHADLVHRFRREAQIMAQLRHPNIVEVFDIGQEGDTHYFLMEFIEGVGLDRLLGNASEPMPFSRALTITTQIGHALAYAHQQNPAVVHRDIKPANILIENGTGRVVVTDFGIAKVLDYDQTQYTQVGAFIGTVRYSAPEQLRGEAALDGRVDIYALGILLYEMVSGQRLNSDVNDAQLMARLLDAKKKLPLVFDTPVPPGFQQVVDRAISKDRAQRYPTVEAFLNDLKHFDDEAAGDLTGAATVVAAHPATAGEKLPGTRRRVVASVSIAALLIFSVSAWVYFGTSSEQGAASPDPATPAVITREPDTDAVRLQAGETLTFAIGVADGQTHEYEWRMNGQRVADTPEWHYRAIPGQHEVTASVSSGHETIATGSWSVTVSEPPPVFSSLVVRPEDSNLTVPACEAAAFEVLDAPDAAEFTWRLNGQTVNGDSRRYVVSDIPAGSHVVSVAAHHSQETASFSWEVTAQDRVDQAQAQDWLRDYVSALQIADIEALRRMGFIRQDAQADRMRATLEQRQRYEVAIDEVSIKPLSNSAELKFRQVDRWYDPTTFSTVVDHTIHTMTLAREGCSALVAR